MNALMKLVGFSTSNKVKNHCCNHNETPNDMGVSYRVVALLVCISFRLTPLGMDPSTSTAAQSSCMMVILVTDQR